MLPDVDLEIDVENLLASSRETGSKLATLLEKIGKTKKFPAGSILPPPTEAEYHVVTKGCIYFGSNETTHRLYQKGDLFLRSPSLDEESNQFHVDFAAESTSISESQLLEQQRINSELQKAWLEYEGKRTHLLLAFAQSLNIPPKRISPNLQRFKAGSTIIVEGTKSECVYVLLEGEATVKLAEKSIGSICQNEIFGEMGFLTQSNRSATVHAQTDCVVQTLDRDSFGDLISKNNTALLEIATQLAKRVVTLDKLLANDDD